MWAAAVSAVLGIWMMAAPSVLQYADAARTSDRILGPLIATFATVAMWQVLRPLRHVNLVLGIALIVVPWILAFPWGATINSVAVGIVVAALSRVRGNMSERYGGGWSALWK